MNEFLKELGRISLISALPVLILALESGVDWKTVAVLVAVAILKGLDKWLHKSGVAERGLVRF